MALFLFNTSRFISPALVLSSLLLLIPLLPWLYLPRNASPIAPASDPYSPGASLPPPETRLESLVGGRRCAGRVSSPSSPPAIPEQQQGVDSSNTSSEGKLGLGLLARTIDLLPEVEVAAPVVGPILASMPLKDLTSRPLEFLQSLLVASVAGALCRSLCGMVIPEASTQAARRTLLQLRRDARRLDLEEGSVLPIFSAHLKAILFGLVVNALDSLLSGSLVWFLVFWAYMPTTRTRLQFSIQISVVLELLAWLGYFCLVPTVILAMQIIWLKITLFLKGRHHQPAMCHRENTLQP